MALARTGFKNKPRKPLKRTPLARTSALKASKTPLGASKRKKTPTSTKTPKKGYQVPKWFKSLPLGSHGSSPAQKKLWKVISDTYRKEDWEKYNGKCVSCETRLERWQDGQLAHFKAWSVCNSWFKFERKNLALSCPNCNRLSDGMVGLKFAQELQRRHGHDILEWIEIENLKYRGQKLEVSICVDNVAQLRPDLVR